MNEKTLWLSPRPETNKLKLKASDVVYLWECASRNPVRAAQLVVRGKVIQPATIPMNMPAWQQRFCVDETTGYSGPEFHRKMPRAEIEIQKWLAAGKKVDRDDTDSNSILRQNSFFRRRGYYNATIFDLDRSEALELDKLAGW